MGRSLGIGEVCLSSIHLMGPCPGRESVDVVLDVGCWGIHPGSIGEGSPLSRVCPLTYDGFSPCM